jgi:flagellar motor switch protein FliN/FliY
MLSQDEINALLNGMNTSDNSTDEGNASTEPESGTGTDPAASDATTSDNSVVPAPDEGEPDQSLLSDMEKDAIGEVANISMGSAATTLYSLVNRKVNITTPVVSLAKWSTLTDSYERPCVFIQIKYTKGLDGSDILVLKEHDVKVITDLMMGGDGSNTQDELGELHLSAISEAMNQMMGASATSLSTMLGQMIDISPPEASKVDITQKVKGRILHHS